MLFSCERCRNNGAAKEKKKNVFKTNARDKCLKNFITAQIVRWRFSGSGKPRTLYFIWLRFVLCADKCSLVVAGCYLRAARQDWKKYASFGRFVFFACVTLPTEANLPSGIADAPDSAMFLFGSANPAVPVVALAMYHCLGEGHIFWRSTEGKGFIQKHLTLLYRNNLSWDGCTFLPISNNNIIAYW